MTAGSGPTAADGIEALAVPDEPLGFLSDAHGNAAALEIGIRELRQAGARHLFFLGDAVGYIPTADALRALRREGIPCLRGNHEEALLRGDAGAEREAVYRLTTARRDLREDELRAIAAWPSELVLQVGARRLHLVHGSPRDATWEYVHADTPLAPLAMFAKAPTVVMGHSHRPFIRHSHGVTFVNVGSCGLPRDDARLGSAALFEPGAEPAWRILRFDIEACTLAALERHGAHEAVWDLVRNRREDPQLGGAGDA